MSHGVIFPRIFAHPAASGEALSTDESHKIIDYYRECAAEIITGDRQMAGAIAAIDPLETRWTFILQRNGHALRGRIPFMDYNFNVNRKPTSLELLEFDKLFRDTVSIFTTRFFRYPHMFEYFRSTFVPQFEKFLETRQADEKFRILDVAAATGEEPVTIALIVLEALERHHAKWEERFGIDLVDPARFISIVALDKMALRLENAELREMRNSGRYPLFTQDEFPAALFERYTEKGWIRVSESNLHVSSEVQALIEYVDVDIHTRRTLPEILLRAPYNIVFNLKLFEYLMTENEPEDRMVAAQAFIDAIEGGDCIKADGFYFSDDPQVLLIHSQKAVGWWMANKEDPARTVHPPPIPPLPGDIDWIPTSYADPNGEVVVRQAPLLFHKIPGKDLNERGARIIVSMAPQQSGASTILPTTTGGAILISRKSDSSEGDGSLTLAGAKRSPIVRSTRKIGRNDPCPCGSGKKFKKCHVGG